MSGSAIDRLAERVGIEPFFYDIWGNRHTVATETRLALLLAMGLAADSQEQAESALRQIEQAPWRTPLAPVTVLLSHQPVAVDLALANAADDAAIHWRLIEEEGVAHQGEITVAGLMVSAEVTLEGVSYRRRSLTLPIRPPLGYHRLELSVDGGQLTAAVTAATTIIIAPERCLGLEDLVPGGRAWGLGCQIVSGWGCRTAPWTNPI